MELMMKYNLSYGLDISYQNKDINLEIAFVARIIRAPQSWQIMGVHQVAKELAISMSSIYL